MGIRKYAQPDCPVSKTVILEMFGIAENADQQLRGLLAQSSGCEGVEEDELTNLAAR